MERRRSSLEGHNEEELNSDLDDDDSSIKAAKQPSKKRAKPSSLLKLCTSSVGNNKNTFLSPLQLLFACILLLIQFHCLFVHGLFGFLSRLEFLPLLLTSVSCAVGVVWSWLLFYHQVVFSWVNYILVTSLIFLPAEGLTHFLVQSEIGAYRGWPALITTYNGGFAWHCVCACTKLVYYCMESRNLETIV